MRNAEYRVPGWLREVLPERRPPWRIVLGGDLAYWAERPGAPSKALGSDIVAAYEQLGGEDVVFTDEVVARFSDGDAHPMRGWISIPENRPDGIVRGYRLLMARSDDERLSHLEDAYECFLEADAAWRAEPSFYNAWHWLDAHPAFWTRPRHVSEVIASARGRDAGTREEPWAARLWDWETSGYCEKLWVRPFRDSAADDDARDAADNHARDAADDDARDAADAVQVAVEAGGHVPDLDFHESGGSVVVVGAYLEHYHDPRLDVAEPSYEDAITALAVKVDRFFAPDGEPRPNVPYEKSAWELETAQAIEDYERNYPDRADWHAALPRIPFAEFMEDRRTRAHG